MLDIRGLLRAFRHAGAGWKTGIRTQQSFQIQVAVGFVVLLAVAFLSMDALVRAVVVLVVATVIAFELFNTALERLANVVSPGFDPSIRDMKDLSAAAVLTMALGAVAVGLLIFWG